MAYTLNIPSATQLISASQPLIQDNFNSANTVFAIDHFGFADTTSTNGQPNRGTHKQVQIRNAAGINGAVPAGINGTGWETIYSSATAGSGELWFVRGSGPTGIQLTGPGTPIKANTGYTFLPGGILMQWGRKSFSGGGSSKQDVNIVYTTEGLIAMPNATFVAFATLRNKNNTSSTAQISTSTRTSTGFVVHYTGGSDYDEFQWMAIGN